MNHNLVEHGDEVRDIALYSFNSWWCNCCLWINCLKMLLHPSMLPYKLEDKDGHVNFAIIKAYGDATNTFV